MSKSELLAIRVNPGMKSAIEELALKSRRELSDYVRLVLEDAIKNKTKV